MANRLRAGARARRRFRDSGPRFCEATDPGATRAAITPTGWRRRSVDAPTSCTSAPTSRQEPPDRQGARLLSGTTPRCLMGLANVDNGFLAKATLAEAQRCVFSGVPAATEMPSAKTVRASVPRVVPEEPWACGVRSRTTPRRILLAAISRAKNDRLRRRRAHAPSDQGVRGATGTITIDPKTGYRYQSAGQHPPRRQPQAVRDSEVSASDYRLFVPGTSVTPRSGFLFDRYWRF